MANTEWMSIIEVASVLGISTSRIGTLAKRKQWRKTQAHQEGRPPMTFYAARDVMNAIERDEQKRTLAFIVMRDWADSLPDKYVPGEDEMAAHSIAPFKVADMRSLIETRGYRREAVVLRRPRSEEAA